MGIERAKATGQALAPKQSRQSRLLDVEHAVDQARRLGVPGVRLFGIHQRQGSRWQRVALTAALVAAHTLYDRPNGKRVVTVAPERLAGKVGVEQLDSR